MKTKESLNASETSGATKRPPVTKENFGGYYEKHYQEIFRFCLRVLRNYDDAEDAAQETFVKAFLNLEKFDEKKSSFRTWIFRIAYNTCIDESRRRRPKPLEEIVAAATDNDVPPIQGEKTTMRRPFLLPENARISSVLSMSVLTN